MSVPVRPLVRWTFYGFVFSLLFEVPTRNIPVETHTLTGSIFLAAALLQPRLCFGRPPAAFWWFAAYLYVFVVLGVTTDHVFDFVKNSLLFLQVLLLFLAGYNLMKEERLARGAVAAFGGACGAMALLFLTGVTATVMDTHTRFPRLTAMDQNPNTFAHNLSFGLIALVGLAYGTKAMRLLPRAIAWLMGALIGITIVQTGSRGAVLALAAGLLAFGLRPGRSVSRLRAAVVALAVVGLVGWIAYQSEAMRMRFESTIESGDMAQRELLFPASWDMFLEKPLTGWRPGNYLYELASRVPHRERSTRETHNMWLELLTSTGLIGALPFCVGMWLCVRGAWRARTAAEGMLPLALTVAVLVTKLGSTRIYAKTDWLIFSMALAAATRAPAAAAIQRLAAERVVVFAPARFRRRVVGRSAAAPGRWRSSPS